MMIGISNSSGQEKSPAGGGKPWLTIRMNTAGYAREYHHSRAVTDNGSFVAGLNRYFTLTWEYESAQSPDSS